MAVLLKVKQKDVWFKETIMAGCGKKMKKGGSVDKDFEKYVSKKVAEDNKKRRLES